MSVRSRLSTVLLSLGLLLPLTGIVPTQLAAADPMPAAAPGDGIDPELQLADLATRGEGGWMRYRIPALTQLDNGDLLAVFDGRPTMNDLPSNITLLMRRSTDGGQTWAPQQVIRSEPAPNGFGDPSVLVDRTDGKVYVFYAASINQGFAGSATGQSPTDPNVLHADYSVSSDNGATWTHRRITADIKQGRAWGGMFAASGEGIQLRTGPNAGRLIQQYTVRIGSTNHAVSVYSDDHGVTWQTSAPVGPGADENKTVELSNGDVLLNSRAAPARLVAKSTDGGATYSAFAADPELPDPANNGSIIRAYPDAPAGDPRARILLFSNTNNVNQRKNLTVRMSCDDGQTWPVSKVVQSGAAGYSTLTALRTGAGERGGRYGLFYERDGYRYLSYTSFGLDWLDGACASPAATPAASYVRGTATATQVVVTNQSGADLAAGSLRVAPGQRFSSTAVGVPAIAAGSSATVSVPVTAAATADTRTHDVRFEYTTAGLTSFTIAKLSVPAGTVTPDASFAIRPVLDAIYTGGGDGLVGDRIQPWVEVVNTGNTTLTGIAFSAPTGIGTACNFSSLAPGASYACKNNSPSHIITTADQVAGEWSTTYSATATAAGATITATADLFPVDLTEAMPFPGDAAAWVPTGAFATSSFARVPLVGGVGTPLAAAAPLALRIPANSRASAQLALTTKTALSGVRATATPLKIGAASLPADAIQVRYPEYIKDDNNPGNLVADPLRAVPSVDVAAGQNQPVWLTVDIPAGTLPGRYTSQVTLSHAGGDLGTWPLTVDVPDVEYRDMADRPFTLDLWPHPDAVADQLGLELWSEEHFQALKPYWADLGSRGQRVLNLAITEDPWLVSMNGTIRPQTASHYGSTVRWTNTGSGFTFDFSVFDRLVTDARAAGIGDRIHAFTMLQFQGHDRINYYNAAGTMVTETVTVGSPRYTEAWSAFLTAFRAHLVSKGWFDDTSIAFDEQALTRMNAAFAVIKAADPAWEGKIALAANSLAEADIADYISFNYTFLGSVPQALIEQRRAAGEPTLFYTWNEPTLPNTVVKTPPFNARTLGWVVEQKNLDGYLRWTYNSWPADIKADPTFRYGQGDEYIVYPGADGPVSSIRWELFKDGQEDAELLNLAKQQLGARNATLQAALSGVNPTGTTVTDWKAMLTHRDAVIDALVAGPPPVTSTGPITADRTSVADPITGAITLSVPVRNSSDQPQTVSLAVEGNEVFVGSATKVVAPGETTTVQLVVRPQGRVGADSLTATLSLGDITLERTALDLVSGGYYLSDVNWATATNGWGPVEKDRANGENQAGDGPVMKLGGTVYTKGLGTHAQSTITYALGGTCSTLRFDYGIDDAMRTGAASVIFTVLGDGTRKWTSGVVTGSTPPGSATIDVTGVTSLTLDVNPNGGNGQDHADWAGIWVQCATADATAPVVTAALNGTARTVTLTATDNAHVASIEYRLGEGAWTAYTAPFTVGPAETVVTYRATDAVGNVAAEQRLTVPAATGPEPTATVTVTPPPVTATATVTVTPPPVTTTATATVTPPPVTSTATVTMTPPPVTATTTATATVVVTPPPVTATTTATATVVVTPPPVTATVTPPPVTTTVTASPTTAAPPPAGSLYTTPGLHVAGGRHWFTRCEPYSATITRCRTDIWATTVHLVNGVYTPVTGWAFNNQTYLPVSRATWGSHPLANPGSWTVGGRRWMTECGTPATGPQACRSYIYATVVQAQKTASGSWTYSTVNKWVLNNIVLFTD